MTEDAFLFGGTVTKFIVQSSWDEPEDEELHDYIKSIGVPLEVMDEDRLISMRPTPSAMVFADTSIIQHLVSSDVVSDTYPDRFASLYRRWISKGPLSKLARSQPLPFFVKPAGKHKAFDARVVRTADDLEKAATDADGELVYVCEAVEFICEHRLFIGSGRLWGSAEYSDHVLHDGSIVSTVVPSELVDEVLRLNGLGFLVVDVGLKKDGDWCVVEANPPFALSSYGLDIGIYVEYCCAAWSHLLRKQ